MFDIDAKTVTIVQSATIHLDAAQVNRLADALPSFLQLLENKPTDGIKDLLELLEQLDILRGGNGTAPQLGTLAGPGAAGDIPKPKRAPRDTKRKQIDRDWLLDQYITLGRSTTDIALELACSTSTISKYLREHGITARRRSGRPPSDPTPAPAKMSPGGGYAGTSPGRGASAGSSD